MKKSFLLIFFLCVLFSVPVFCEPNSLIVPISRDTIQVDGVLDDPAWQRISRFVGFVDVHGKEIVGHQTGVSIFSDGKALCIALECMEPEVSRIVSDATGRDGAVWRDDSVEVFIQASTVGSDYFHFILNSKNALLDEKGWDKTWNANIQTGARIGNGLWSAEFRIPFDELGETPSDGEEWRINLCRNRSAGGPHQMSSWTVLTGQAHAPKRFGVIRFANEVPRWRIQGVESLRLGQNAFAIRLAQVDSVSVKVASQDGKSVFLDSSFSRDSTISWFYDGSASPLTMTISGRDGWILYRARWLYLPSQYDSLTNIQKSFQESEKAFSNLPKDLRESFAEAQRIDDRELREIVAVRRDVKALTPDIWRDIESRAASLEGRLRSRVPLILARSAYPDSPFAVGVCSSMEKVFIRDHAFPGTFGSEVNLSMARGEREAFQICVLPFTTAIRNVRLELYDLKNWKGAFSKENISVSLVGHVQTKAPSYKVDYIGWYPDPILDFQKTCDALPGEAVSFWVEFSAPQKIAPGNYHGEIQVLADGCAPKPVHVNLRVWDFVVSRPYHLETAFTYGQNSPKEIYETAWNETLRDKYEDALFEDGIDVDSLYRNSPPSWPDIDRLLAKGLRNFNLVELSKNDIDPTTKRYNPAHLEQVLKMLDEYVPELRKRGLMDKAYIYGFDEATVDLIPAIRDTLQTIKKRFPDLRIMTTAYDYSWGRDTGLFDLVDIWVPRTNTYDLDDARILRSKGKEMWWYICIGPPHPYANWFIEYPAIESRLLTGAMSSKYEVPGFLYYSTVKWQGTEPIAKGPYTNWIPASYRDNNGDGSLFCPGPNGPLNTIRSKNIRDGFEDYEYHYQLKKLYEAKGKKISAKNRKLVERLLAVPTTVVSDLTQYTGDPEAVYRWRESMAQWILKLQGKPVDKER